MSGTPANPLTEATMPGDPDGVPTKYRPSDHEPRIWDLWERSGAFHADPARAQRGDAEPYCITIPPPNVTDRLHLGHALNNTLQDVLVRARRMMGFETLWMPGTDHAGIATQAVVERRLRKEGRLTGPLRESMTREEFVAIVQSFKDEYEATITGQLKAMGCSCDWARQRFTMDEQCARAVHEAFFRLFRDGLIYRGKRLVNWDPVLQTAVADDECEDVEVDGNFYYLRYPLVHAGRAGQDAVPVTWSELRRRGWPDGDDAEHADEAPAWATVATTRPETYLGDTAVAVNPRDPRAGALRGLSVELPLVGRVVPIIEDSYVVMPALSEGNRGSDEPEDPKATFATGFLKVTPAHDPNDYEIGQRHGLPTINIFAPDATISNAHGWSDPDEHKGAHVFLGLSREEARRKVVMEFKARGLCEKVVPYRHSVKHSDRSGVPVEPYLSDQWFVKVTDDRLAGAALRALAPASPPHARATGGKPVLSSTHVRGTGGMPVPREGGEHRPDACATSLGRGAREIGDGILRFHPDRYAKTYQSWHESIRDWCISRQLWWGHRVPVWTIDEKAHRPLNLTALLEAWVRAGRVHVVYRSTWLGDATGGNGSSPDDAPGHFVCVRDPGDREVVEALESGGYTRDPDVLDTWFSSALWPMSTMGWPHDTDLLRAFNPTDVLCTAREIITLWVSRMVMFERYLMPADWPDTRAAAGSDAPGAARPGTLDDMGRGAGPVPFRDVFIHAMIQDGEGRKMSKSLGNGVDPLDIIASHGADAMRFTLCHMATHTQDVRMPVERDPRSGKNSSKKFDLGRNFCTKLWNAARFALSLLPSTPPPARGTGVPPVPPSSPIAVKDLALPDRWMLSRLAAAAEEVDRAVSIYEFSTYAQRVYDLTWRDFCDWYLEAIKPTVASDAGQRAVLARTLEVIVRLLHPIMPFVTEVIWERLRRVDAAPIPGIEFGPSRREGLLCTAGWPSVSASLRDDEAERRFDRLRGLVTAIREVRATHQVPPKHRVTLHVPPQLEAECRAGGMGDVVAVLAGLDAVSTNPPTGAGVTFIVEGVECRLSNLADEVDAAAERSRLSRRLADLDKSIATLEARLANPGYVDRAPPAMVQQTRDQLARARAERDAASASPGRA